MANPTDHRITADIGEGLRVEISYVYTPPTPGDKIDNDYPAELEVVSATVLCPDDAYNKWFPVYVREAADNWLQDEGYDAAVQLAERERHGDWE